MSSWQAGVLVTALVAAGTVAAAGRQPVPASFEHHRVILTPTLDGRTLRFYTDTGGGPNALAESVVAELGMEPREIEGQGEPLRVVAFPRFDAEASIPAPPPYFLDGQLMVTGPGHLFGTDGFLGGRWFADRVWEFDYPAGTLTLLDAGPDAGPGCVALGFQEHEGQRTTHFPSIDVTVDGELVPMLFDTGATFTTTEDSAPMFGVGPGTQVAGSFIDHDVFERWRAAHADWQVVEKGDFIGGSPRRMIEVPTIEVAGIEAGPVWFSERPAGTFPNWMSSMMDRQVLGALGGSGLRYFRVVADYPGSRACFHDPAASG